MKTNFIIGILLILIVTTGIAQNNNQNNVNKISINKISDEDKYNRQSVCGNILFQEENKRILDYISAHPEYIRQTRSLKKPQSYNVGDTKNWWIQIEPDNGPSFVEMPSVCKAVGEHCYIFVSDESWSAGKITQSQIDEMVNSFDNETPNFSSKGIYEVDVETFGNPPNFDGDDKIIIFFYDIEDDYESTGAATLGYFWSKDQITDGDPALGVGNDQIRSNEAEIFYMDTHPLLDIFGIGQAKSTLAHEFQHMIHHRWDDNEMTFINEGLSEIAEHVCGYGVRSNSLYAQNSNRSLLNWDGNDALPDYSRASHWMLYIYEQYPSTDILMDFVRRTHGNYASIDNTLRGMDQSRGFFNVFEEWLIANYANGYSSDPRYGYQYSPRTQPVPATTHIGNNGEGSGTINPLSAEYITFSGGDDLSITFTGDVIYKIRALKIGSLEVENIDKNTIYTPSGYGTTYPEITFLLYNDSPGSSQNYSYIATGSDVSVNMELAYEDGTPDGSFEWTTGDSIAVIFSGLQGASLDSIKTFYDGTGKIEMEISKYDGNNFLRGENIYSSNRNVLNSDNWNKVNLVSHNIDASEDFVVSYLVGADPNNPTVRVSPESDTGEYHSRTYTNNNGTTQWWIFHNGDTPQLYWNYLIRAYLSIGGGTVAIDQNGIVSIPDEFNLGENYPNPFNPTTTFNFATPSDGLVKFTVHDLLGREIYSEHRNLLAGNYSFTWDGQNNLDQQVVSGVYFLKMEANGFAQTRKMLMMK